MPPGDVSGPPLAQSPANTLINVLSQQITVLVVNAQSINSEFKLARLTHLLQTHLPTLVAVLESWLDVSTRYLSIAGYQLVARRDRTDYIPHPNTSNHGGVMLYVRTNTILCTLEEVSYIAERVGNCAYKYWTFNIMCMVPASGK